MAASEVNDEDFLELDVRVAFALGWKRRDGTRCVPDVFEKDGVVVAQPPAYSRKIEHAWECVEYLVRAGNRPVLFLDELGHWGLSLKAMTFDATYRSTAPLAIVRAFLEEIT